MSVTTEEIKEVGLVKEGIDAISTAIKLYSEEVDQKIPWKKFQNITKDMLLYDEHYSEDSLKLISSARSIFLNALDEHYCVTQLIYEWCGVTIQIFHSYFIEYSMQTTFEVQNFLMKVFDNGLRKMDLCVIKLVTISENFKNALKEMKALLAVLAKDFDTNSTYFKAKKKSLIDAMSNTDKFSLFIGPFGLLYDKLGSTGFSVKEYNKMLTKMMEVKGYFENVSKDIKFAVDSLNEVIPKFRNAITNVENLKLQIAEAKDDTEASTSTELLNLLQSTTRIPVDELINLCMAFQSRYGKINK